MRISVKAAMLSTGLLWGGCILVLGILNLVAPPFGANFLHLISSIYPGYHASGTLGDSLVGAGYALVDGGVGGLLLAWLYNAFVGRRTGDPATT